MNSLYSNEVDYITIKYKLVRIKIKRPVNINAHELWPTSTIEWYKRLVMQCR
jgi:hypothetical protein